MPSPSPEPVKIRQNGGSSPPPLKQLPANGNPGIAISRRRSANQLANVFWILVFAIVVVVSSTASISVFSMLFGDKSESSPSERTPTDIERIRTWVATSTKRSSKPNKLVMQSVLRGSGNRKTKNRPDRNGSESAGRSQSKYIHIKAEPVDGGKAIGIIQVSGVYDLANLSIGETPDKKIPVESEYFLNETPKTPKFEWFVHSSNRQQNHDRYGNHDR